ncbi:hypothetical protein AK812_SmicGene38798 [Symbiodinium microadriaticum]|uniref:Uncharacterized protein n=1 Tax=Symbiodinium microadriaticum TaxID=2951 RepID=A0A1Q9CD34_SYMMI|nr:hypothetical protein AK812_SmicGene38798 [Symbiodinium microadriaticum]
MRAYITQNIKAVTPFHVPKTSVVFAKHPCVSQLLFNHKDALLAWAAKHPLICCCDELCQWAPDAPVFQGHIAATVEDFTTSAFSTVEKDILNGSMANTFFPESVQLFEQFHQAWISWCRANDLPGPPQGLREVFNNLQNKHHQAAQGHSTAFASFPQSFAKGDVYALITEVQDFLKNSSDDAVHCRNQDLSGFFTSISTAQFQHAWTVTRESYRQRHGLELDTVYTVNLKEQQQVARVFRGRRRQKATREFRIHSADIPTIIFHSLQLQFFTVVDRGMPTYLFAIFAAMNRNLLCLRYVDNRLWISEDYSALENPQPVPKYLFALV